MSVHHTSTQNIKCYVIIIIESQTLRPDCWLGPIPSSQNHPIVPSPCGPNHQPSGTPIAPTPHSPEALQSDPEPAAQITHQRAPQPAQSKPSYFNFSNQIEEEGWNRAEFYR